MKQKTKDPDMGQLLVALIESSKQNKKGFMKLKEATVDLQQFELASKLREIEKESFPESKEVKDAKLTGRKLNLLFRMVDLNISDDLCWLISETFKKHEKNDKFNLQDAANLVAEWKRIFDK